MKRELALFSRFIGFMLPL